MRLCAYSGLNGKPRFGLLRSTVIRSSALRRKIVHELDQLRRASGVAECPADDGSQIVGFLAYARRRQVTISVATSGCEVVSNGDITRTAAGTHFLSLLEQVTAVPPTLKSNTAASR
jgi:hypothetical protein